VQSSLWRKPILWVSQLYSQESQQAHIHKHTFDTSVGLVHASLLPPGNVLDLELYLQVSFNLKPGRYTGLKFNSYIFELSFHYSLKFKWFLGKSFDKIGIFQITVLLKTYLFIWSNINLCVLHVFQYVPHVSDSFNNINNKQFVNFFCLPFDAVQQACQ